MKRTFINSQTTRVYDKKLKQWREVEVQKVHVVTLEEFDKFHMVYYNMMKSFYQIKYVKDVMLLFKLCEGAKFNTGVINLSAKERVDLCAFLNVRQSHLSAGIKRLVELGLIFGDKGQYQINEGVFWRGDKEIRNMMLKNRGLEFIVRFKADNLVIDSVKENEKTQKAKSKNIEPNVDFENQID